MFSGIKEAFNGVRSPRKYGNMNSDPRLHAHEVPPHRRYLGNKPPNRMIARIKGKIRKRNAENPPGDLMERLSETEMQFLVEHGLAGNHVSIDDLEHLEAGL